MCVGGYLSGVVQKGKTEASLFIFFLFFAYMTNCRCENKQGWGRVGLIYSISLQAKANSRRASIHQCAGMRIGLCLAVQMITHR